MRQLKMRQLKMRQLKMSRGGRHADEHMCRRYPTVGHSQMPACHIWPPIRAGFTSLHGRYNGHHAGRVRIRALTNGNKLDAESSWRMRARRGAPAPVRTTVGLRCYPGEE